MAKIEMRAVPNHPAVEQTQAAVSNGHRSHVPPTSIDFGMGLGSIDSVRKEIDEAFIDLKNFHNTEPDEVMRLCAGYRARFAEIRLLIQRVEVMNRQWKSVRTNEVEPFLDELKEQFGIASRIIAVRELDWKMSGAGP